MRLPFWILLVCAGCAVRPVSTVPASTRLERAGPAEAPLTEGVAESPPAPPEPVAGEAPPEPAPARQEALVASSAAASEPPEGEADSEASEDGEGEGEEGETDEGESTEASTGAEPGGPLYTADLSDEELARRWKAEPGSIGSVSVGFVHAGRMLNSVRVPQGEEWIVVSPALAWATEETVEYLTRVIREVRAQHPHAPPLRVNQLSSKDGGYLRPHKSHQNGRDVDLGFYYPTAEPVRARERERYIDPALNWALVRALVTSSDVQMILVDRRVQKVLYDHALKLGEDKEWLDSLFHAGARSIIKHARRHRDHFHVRFFNPRAQELGRRLAPLLALQPDKNIAMHRVRSGDTLGGIALRYNSSVKSIQRANRMRGTFLRVGQVLSVPLRGPCTRCPVPPPVVVPPRRLPVAKKDAPLPTEALPVPEGSSVSEEAPATRELPAPAGVPVARVQGTP